MENNPKKSKAFIITFILILILLVGGYYLFKNRTQIFDAKGSTSIGKIFSPLLGTSKDKDLKVIEDPNKNTTTPTVPKKTGVVITDINGNKLVIAEAGELLKKGDVLYIAGFNKNDQPIVMKAIANDKNKSLVFGVANEDMDKGALGSVLIEGVLSGVPTNRKEGTLWAANNTLYLSDKIYGGMTKNSPKAPSYVVPVGSVITVDPVNGSIRIGNVANNTNISDTISGNLNKLNMTLLSNSNMELINAVISDLRDYWGSIFGDYGLGIGEFDPNLPPLTPITLPDFDSGTNGISAAVRVVANPASVEKNGSSTITWTSINTTSCTLYGGGILDATGTSNTTGIKTRELGASTAITVTCKGKDDSFVSDTVVVNVVGSNTNNIPTVNIKANPTTVKYTETSTITWTSTKTKSCTVSGFGISATGTSNTKGIKTKSLRRPETTITLVCIGTDGSAVSDNVVVKTVKDATDTTQTECSSPKITDTDGSCINIADCKSPKVVNGNKCEMGSPTTENMCKDIDKNPLTFTEEEKARLAVLLRKFYLVSSTLKTTDDITTIYNEIDQQKNFINQIGGLTKQCYLQTNNSTDFINFCSRNSKLCDPSPADEFFVESNSDFQIKEGKRFGNPWYTKTTGSSYSYTDNKTYLNGDSDTSGNGYLNYGSWLDNLDGEGKGPGCKAVSGYYYGTLTKPIYILKYEGGFNDTIKGKEGDSCDIFNTFPQYNNCWAGTAGRMWANDKDHQPHEKALIAGCKWHDGVNLSDVERLLNIW